MFLSGRERGRGYCLEETPAWQARSKMRSRLHPRNDICLTDSHRTKTGEDVVIPRVEACRGAQSEAQSRRLLKSPGK